MTLHQLTPDAKQKIEIYKKKRLEILQSINFTDLLSGRFFLSGEIKIISDLVYYRLDEHFCSMTNGMFAELRKQLPETKQIGYLISDPAFDAEWDRKQNKFTTEFSETFTINGEINWQKLSEIPINN